MTCAVRKGARGNLCRGEPGTKGRFPRGDSCYIGEVSRGNLCRGEPGTKGRFPRGDLCCKGGVQGQSVQAAGGSQYKGKVPVLATRATFSANAPMAQTK